ncbi:hypothetical protein [Streptomyces sp. NRRL S-474]|uniref:hypothetical protein n=1 Tax=Streptomyces sp. NRRL S-474 TaxID=1463909 RepID=UPI000ADE9C12|nr:hypothetical protein [Streptomyces sp. NRRL S-474]
MTSSAATAVRDKDGLSALVCGRCVTWYPVGIDITEEAAALHDELADRLRREKQKETER